MPGDGGMIELNRYAVAMYRNVIPVESEGGSL